MKLQALALALLALVSVSHAHAAEPAKAASAKTTKPAAKPDDAANADPQVKAALSLTEQQIKSTTNRDALSKLAQLYNGRDVQRLIWSMERLVELYPNSGALRMQLAALYAGQDDKTRAYDALVKMQTLGFAYQVANDPNFVKVRGTRVWDYIVANLDANAKPFGEGKVAFELPGNDRLFEALAWDAKKKQLLAGSAREGIVYRVDDKGQLTEFIKPDADGPWAIMDMKADAERDVLWVASYGGTVYKGYNAQMVNKSNLLKYRLSTGKLLAKYGSAGGYDTHVFSSIAVAQDGRVFVADPSRHEIYKLDGDNLQTLASNPQLTSIKGLTISGDGSTLYFADPSLGLFGIDLKQNKPFVVMHSPDSLVVGGIDTMTWYDGTLVVVQGSMVPPRVMRLKLDATGRSVELAVPLDAAKPEFAALGNATAAGDDIYYVANSQRDEYDSYGVPKEADALQPAKIYKSNMRYAWGQPGISTAIQAKPIPTDGKMRYTPVTPRGKPADGKPAGDKPASDNK